MYIVARISTAYINISSHDDFFESQFHLNSEIVTGTSNKLCPHQHNMRKIYIDDSIRVTNNVFCFIPVHALVKVFTLEKLKYKTIDWSSKHKYVCHVLTLNISSC